MSAWGQKAVNQRNSQNECGRQVPVSERGGGEGGHLLGGAEGLALRVSTLTAARYASDAALSAAGGSCGPCALVQIRKQCPSCWPAGHRLDCSIPGAQPALPVWLH